MAPKKKTQRENVSCMLPIEIKVVLYQEEEEEEQSGKKHPNINRIKRDSGFKSSIFLFTTLFIYI